MLFEYNKFEFCKKLEWLLQHSGMKILQFVITTFCDVLLMIFHKVTVIAFGFLLLL